MCHSGNFTVSKASSTHCEAKLPLNRAAGGGKGEGRGSGKRVKRVSREMVFVSQGSKQLPDMLNSGAAAGGRARQREGNTNTDVALWPLCCEVTSDFKCCLPQCSSREGGQPLAYCQPVSGRAVRKHGRNWK